MAWLIAFWGLLALLLWTLSEAYPGALEVAGARQDLVYLTLFLALIGGSVLASFRGRLGQALRFALVWALILVALVGAYAWREEASEAAKRALTLLVPSEPVTSGEREVTVRVGPDGHFRVWAEIEGERVQFVVDTGASTIALTAEDAARVGLEGDDLVFDQPVITANGRAYTAGADLAEVAIGPIRLDGVTARVMQAGVLDRSLLGMSFLSRLESVELRGPQLVMRQ